jgi:hypothetical protein
MTWSHIHIHGRSHTRQVCSSHLVFGATLGPDLTGVHIRYTPANLGSRAQPRHSKRTSGEPARQRSSGVRVRALRTRFDGMWLPGGVFAAAANDGLGRHGDRSACECAAMHRLPEDG